MASSIGIGREMLRAWGNYERNAERIELPITEMLRLAEARESLRPGLEREIQRNQIYLEQLTMKAEIVQGYINRCCDERMANILRRRYRDGQKWIQIGKWENIDESYCRRLEKMAAYELSKMAE